MKFKLFSNAFIKIPTVMDDGDGTRFTKMLDTRVTHPDGSPISPALPLVIDFPSNLPLDSISRRWEALDDEAKEAQAKLGKPVSNLAGDTIGAPAKAADPLSIEGIFAALAAASPEDKAKLANVLGVAPAAPAPAAAPAGGKAK